MNLNEMFAALDATSQNRIATDMIIAEDVANDNREVGTLKTRVDARIAKLATGIADDVNAATPENVETVDRLIKTLAQPESPKVAAENAKRAKAGKPKMTAEEARRFEMYSEKNAGIVEEAAADRGCECEAYVSIFTFNRWIAQGRVVKKGEKATFVQVPNFREVVDEKTGEKRKIKIGERRVAVFCKCQTKKLEPKSKAA